MLSTSVTAVGKAGKGKEKYHIHHNDCNNNTNKRICSVLVLTLYRVDALLKFPQAISATEHKADNSVLERAEGWEAYSRIARGIQRNA